MSVPARNIQVGDSVDVNRKLVHGTARRALIFAASYSRALMLFLFVVVADAIIVIMNPLIYRVIVDRGILKGDTALIVQLAALIAGIAMLEAALGVGQTYLASRIGASVVVALRTRIFGHILGMPLGFFATVKTGALVNRLMGDIDGARSAFTDILSNVVGNFVTFIMIVTAMLALSWRITLVLLVVLPLFVLPAHCWGRRIQALARQTCDVNAQLSSLMVERFNVAGALLAKLFGRSDDDINLFEAKSRALSSVGVRRALYERMFAILLLLMAAFATALAYGWGGVLVVRRSVDLGTLVALVSLLGRLYAPLMGLSSVQVSLMTTLVSFERIFEVLDLQPNIAAKPNARAISTGPMHLEFHRVWFRYPAAEDISLASLEDVGRLNRESRQTILRDINFSVAPGQMVALIGPSGSGKTTITHMIPRLYDVSAGAVRINGMDVRDIAPASLRERIGIVTQDAHLFHDTVRANLIYARPTATEDEIWVSLRDAQILDLVKSLPDGLDTVVGERGYRFSGGEKQRLAIARLLLKSPDLIILDEATAHLDSSSEASVQRSLDRILSGRTAIIIAHRLSTVRKADQIIVLQDGRIVERGTHAQLLAAHGLYGRFHDHQFLSSLPPGGA